MYLSHPLTSAFDVTPLANEPDTSSESRTPFYRELFASDGETKETHAAAVHAMEEGVQAYWYGGTREGAGDVRIYQARFTNDEWQTPVPVTDRLKVQTELQRYIRKVGNPVSYRWDDGTIWVFFVSVSVGGWAGSSINLMESSDQGKTWLPARRLVTSPFLNLSTLVRNPPVRYQDGTIGLPVYHEFLGKFAEILRINRSGEILGKMRLSSGTYALQPTIAVLSDTSAIALLRYAGDPPNRVMQLQTFDGGSTWTRPVKLDIPNPNSAVATLVHDGKVIAVLNNLADGRHNLSLAVLSSDSWRVIHAIEDVDVVAGSHEYQFSYPAMTQDSAGLVHLLYTWNKRQIKHVTFNSAWLEEQLL